MGEEAGGCSTDDRLMGGVLTMVASMGHMLFDLLGFWERLQHGRPPLLPQQQGDPQPALQLQPLEGPLQQGEHEVPQVLELEEGPKGFLHKLCRPAGARGAA